MRRSIIIAACSSLAFLAIAGPAAGHHQDFRDCSLLEKRLLPDLLCQPEPEPPAEANPADAVVLPAAPQTPAKPARRCARKPKRAAAAAKRGKRRCARARRNAR